MLELPYFKYLFLNWVDQKETFTLLKVLKNIHIYIYSIEVQLQSVGMPYVMPSSLFNDFQGLLEKSLENDFSYADAS